MTNYYFCTLLLCYYYLSFSIKFSTQKYIDNLKILSHICFFYLIEQFVIYVYVDIILYLNLITINI